MQVFKFGGTSVGSIENIEHVADICLEQRPDVVVVSAMSGETDRLIQLATLIYPSFRTPEYDLIVTSGETIVAGLLSLALKKRGINSCPMTGAQAGIITTDKFSEATIQRFEGKAILDSIQKGILPVITGFQGATENHKITSLGRGGSDTSAVAIAAAIKADKCVIYTDVNGVYTTDPRICSEAKIIRKLDSSVMLEMASQGSKVLHLRSVFLASKWKVPLFIKNTFSDDPGTEIIQNQSHSIEQVDNMNQHQIFEEEIVTGISGYDQDVLFTAKTNLTLPQFFKKLSDNQINIDVIHHQINLDLPQYLSFTVNSSDFVRTQDYLKTLLGDDFTFQDNIAKVSIIGLGVRNHSGVAARMFNKLDSLNIPIILVTTSEINISCIIPKSDMRAAIVALHEEFISP